MVIVPERYNYIGTFLTLRCNLKCPYCLAGDTKIMTPYGFKNIRDIKIGDEVIGFDENRTKRWQQRKLKITKVLNIFTREALTKRIETQTSHLDITNEHPVLTIRGWKDAAKIREKNKIMSVVDPIVPFSTDSIDYKIGYLKGVIEGDGCFRIGYKFWSKINKKYYEQYNLRLYMLDDEALQRSQKYIEELFGIKVFNRLHAISVSKKNEVLKIYNTIGYKKPLNKTTGEFIAGYLAGIFDAEGSYSKNNLRICNKNKVIISNIEKSLNKLKFNYAIEFYEKYSNAKILTIRLKGSSQEKYRFFYLCQPAIKKKWKNLFKLSISNSEKIIKITNKKYQNVYNIETESKTYIANGLCVHNCINKHSILKERKELNADSWIKILNNLDIPDSLNITLEGGEPTLLEGFFDIINNIKRSVDMLTNLQFDVNEFIKKIDPRFFNARKKIGYKSIRVSYHYQDQIELLSKAVRLQNAGFNIGVFSVNSPDKIAKNMEMAERCRKAQMYFYTKDFLGYFDNHLYGYYKYPDSVMAKSTKNVYCRIKELLIAPDGNCFKCHRDLYTDENNIGNIRNENFIIEDIFRECSNYGNCSPCDVKLKTNRFLEMGDCSIEIKNKGD